MVWYAGISLVGMIFIYMLYGGISFAIIKLMTNKIKQAWGRRPARFIILMICVLQAIIGICLFIACCYTLYSGATYVVTTEYGITYTGENDIITAWGIFGSAMAISLIADMLKAVFVLTFAD